MRMRKKSWAIPYLQDNPNLVIQNPETNKGNWNKVLNRELLQFLKRIKTIVTENSFLYKEKKIKVTFSAGVAIRSSYATYENTLQKADMLLYQAKENGRNKIILENGMEI